MSLITGNLVDFQTIPRPGLSPVVVFRARRPATQNAAVFFTRDIEVTPDPSGLFTVSLVHSLATTPYTVYDVFVKWLNGEGIPIGVDELTSTYFPMVVPEEDGLIGHMLQRPPTALEVHKGETNNPAYGFWYQPSIAHLWSNP